MLSNRLARSLHTSARLLDEAKPDLRASAKLFADAARDEAAEEAEIRRRSALSLPHDDAPNWTGDERVEDTVLRMLVDKYKPLRGDFRSADEKLRRAPPSLSVRPAAVEDDEKTSLADLLAARISAAPSSAPVEVNAVPLSPSPSPLPESTHPGSLADVPLLPSIEGHRPWHTTFKAPSHTASVRVGHFSAPRPSSTRVPANPQDEKALRAERAAAKRTASAVRLTSARESTLDYKLGMRQPERRGPFVNSGSGPVSMKAWTNLVEERIEAARRAGKFASLPGRHKPLERSTEEHNPFIARDEFLLNRLVQRQGAAPPWVEIQAELESALNNFRNNLLETWTRRVLRNITMETPPALLPALAQNMTPEAASALRDPHWRQMESAYHASAIRELNDLVRRYNAIAPYTVRRGLYLVDEELERAYAAAGEAIVCGLRERVARGSNGIPISGYAGDDDDGSSGRGSQPGVVKTIGVMDLLRDWWKSRR